jgi:hypothetical protein
MMSTLNVVPAGGDEVGEDQWIRQAKALVEESINYLLAEFLQSPYLHRVEHSLHTRLYLILDSHELLSQRIQFRDGQTTQLIHKEWPETVAQTGRRRGNFDISILSPHLLHNSTRQEFRAGRLTAAIVIEMGLDYGLSHLAENEQKLVRSGVKHGYLLHLVRQQYRDAEVERLILSPKGQLASAYALIIGGKKFWKPIGGTQIVES